MHPRELLELLLLLLRWLHPELLLRRLHPELLLRELTAHVVARHNRLLAHVRRWISEVAHSRDQFILFQFSAHFEVIDTKHVLAFIRCELLLVEFGEEITQLSVELIGLVQHVGQLMVVSDGLVDLLVELLFRLVLLLSRHYLTERSHILGYHGV